MAGLILMAEPRTVVGKKVKQLRRAGGIPGVIYGPGLAGTETVQVTVNARDFDKFYMTHGHATLFGLQVNGASGQAGQAGQTGQAQQVFIREVQLDPVKRTPLHIDFFAPNLRKELTASAPVVLRHLNSHHEGILNQVRDQIEVSALPSAIPHEIEVDASTLVAVGDTIRVENLTVPAGVTIVTAAEEVIASLIAETVEEVTEVEEVAEAVEEAEPTTTEPAGESAS